MQGESTAADQVQGRVSNADQTEGRSAGDEKGKVLQIARDGQGWSWDGIFITRWLDRDRGVELVLLAACSTVNRKKWSRTGGKAESHVRALDASH